MHARTSIWRAALACAVLTGAGLSAAAPVVRPGSSWLLELSRSDTFDFGRYGLSFDGVAETFVHSRDGLVSMTVNESQADLGAGRAAIDIALDFAGGDPFPFDAMVGLGFGVNSRAGAGDALDLTSPVALTAAQVTSVDASGQQQSFDALPDYQRLNAAANWSGGLFDGGHWLGIGTWNQMGVRQIRMHFETQALNPVSSPGTAALSALGLLALAARRRRVSRLRPAR